jgi:4-diphosphocytidyl-2-C-methyl-D-erythritol kinase
MLVLAPAKLNLTLDVLGLRPDGFHDIRSILQTVSLFDEVYLTAAPRLDVESPIVPPESDLVYRAAVRFGEEVGRTPAVRIAVVKKIPIGGGLGGGSSDAAAVLRALNAWYDEPVGPDRLRAMAADLGSDVPFFLVGGTVLAEGRGERLTTLPPIGTTHFLLVKPPFGLSTREVYERWRGHAGGGGHTERFFTSAAGTWHLGNDLMDAAVELRPELGEIVAALRQAGLDAVSMSGSGSTLFAPVRGGEAARAVKEAERRGCEVFLVSSLSTLPEVQSGIGGARLGRGVS